MKIFLKSQFPDHKEGNMEKKSPEIDYEMLAFILNGSIRLKIFINLLEKPNYTYRLARNEKLNVSSAARTIREMEREKIIKCITPTKRKKFYQLTEKALLLKEEVLSSLHEGL